MVNKSSTRTTQETENLRRSSRTNRGKNPRLSVEKGSIKSTEKIEPQPIASDSIPSTDTAMPLRSSTRVTRSKDVKQPVKEPSEKKKKEKSVKPLKTEKKVTDADEEEEIEGIVDCICGATEDDGELMAECEDCLKWQHIVCMTGRTTTRKMPTHYYCSVCRPNLYPNIEALTQAAIERQGKGKVKNNKSKSKTETTKITKSNTKGVAISSKKEEKVHAEAKKYEPSSNNVAARTRKRKSDVFSDTQDELEKSTTTKEASSYTSPIIHDQVKLQSGHDTSIHSKTAIPDTDNHNGTRRKRKVSKTKDEPVNKPSKAPHSEASRKPLQHVTAPTSSTSLSKFIVKVRQGVVDALNVLFIQSIIPKALQLQYVILKQGETVSNISTSFAYNIEKALYDEYALKPYTQTDSHISNPQKEVSDVGPKYRTNFRSVFEILKGEDFTICRRLLDGDLSIHDLIQMKRADTMNPVLRKFAETLRAESIRHVKFSEQDDQTRVDSDDHNNLQTQGDSTGADSFPNEDIDTNIDYAAAPNKGQQQTLDVPECFSNPADTRQVPLNAENLKIWGGHLSTVAGKFLCEGYHLSGPAGLNPSFLWSMCGLTSQITSTEVVPRQDIETELEPGSQIRDTVSMIISTLNQPADQKEACNRVYQELLAHDTFGVISGNSALSANNPKGYIVTLSKGTPIPSYLNLTHQSLEFLEQMLLLEQNVLIVLYTMNRLAPENNEDSNNAFFSNEADKKNWYGGYFDKIDQLNNGNYEIVSNET